MINRKYINNFLYNTILFYELEVSDIKMYIYNLVRLFGIIII